MPERHHRRLSALRLRDYIGITSVLLTVATGVIVPFVGWMHRMDTARQTDSARSEQRFSEVFSRLDRIERSIDASRRGGPLAGFAGQ